MGAGGGGGGYYGGTGGGVDGSNGNEEIAGGGGGSGYVSPGLTNTENLQGVTGTATSGPGQAGQVTAINPIASSDPDYTGTYGKGGGYNSDGAGGYVVITSPSGSSTFTSPGTYTVP